VLVLVPAVGVALSKLLPAVVIGAISVRFLLTGLFGLTGIDGFELAAGLTSPAVALLSLYVGLGLADSKRRAVLLLGRRDAGRGGGGRGAGGGRGGGGGAAPPAPAPGGGGGRPAGRTVAGP
jgi:hypothetical protein